MRRHVSQGCIPHNTSEKGTDNLRCPPVYQQPQRNMNKHNNTVSQSNHIDQTRLPLAIAPHRIRARSRTTPWVAADIPSWIGKECDTAGAIALGQHIEIIDIDFNAQNFTGRLASVHNIERDWVTFYVLQESEGLDFEFTCPYSWASLPSSYVRHYRRQIGRAHV